ncbi:MAG: C-5 sterol desaturase [Thermonema sp.]|uniref:sterol desaturase family protein n=1 Tax=Thermonema sp. TaxID=2231181 RepID=UPI0021DBFE04|nr:sterol desaturase family protein [Thermonema sp.]GIV38467.1 MAG: C-5 sterol desaturase [Thermonema sp.]
MESLFWHILDGGMAKTIAAISYIILITIEIVIAVRKNLKLYSTRDTFNNLMLGAITSVVKIFIKGVTLAFFGYLHQQYALFDIPANAWWSVLLLFLLNDLIFYWYHRLGHESRFFWATHVAHHSSQLFNFSTAIRGNFIHFFYRFFFWAPLAILGFDPLMIVLIDEIGFYYQMFIHTKTIGKLHPVIEFIFNTPSHHRVHHGSNPAYIDKNYGAVLIIWDRLFGTFAEEKEEVRYGLTKNLTKQNVPTILLHEFQAIAQDVAHAPDWKSKWRYVFGHPGWRHDQENTQKAEYANSN